jgi:hypothetical protein
MLVDLGVAFEFMAVLLSAMQEAAGGEEVAKAWKSSEAQWSDLWCSINPPEDLPKELEAAGLAALA